MATESAKKVIKTEYWHDDVERIAYQEWDDGSWKKREFDENGRLTYQECSDGRWAKQKWDAQGELEHLEQSNGYYFKNYKNEQGQRVQEYGDKNGWTKFIHNADGFVREDSTGYREKCEYDENGFITSRINLNDGTKYI